MKKYFFIWYIGALGLFLYSSCRKALKNVDDYLPKVHIVSAVIQNDGSVLVTGEIDSPGYSTVEYAGFCCNTVSQPDILNRQAIADVNGSTFTAVYQNFDVDSVYYFRAWATNDQGYAYGTELSLNQIIAPPVTPACSLVINKLDNGTGNATPYYAWVSAPVYSSQFWQFSALPQGQNTLYFKFGSQVTTGIYTTDDDHDPAAGHVFVEFNVGGSYRYLEPGTQVYVNTIGTDTFDITICNAPWKVGTSTTFSLNTRFQCPY
ncbi:MAG: hypothetical protein V4580_14260 [Bacteroidota bacterium]